MTKNNTRQFEFVKWFGPLLDALRQLGGSGKPREVSNTIAINLKIPDKQLEKRIEMERHMWNL